MSKRVGVILSGCGVMDGAEIHEAVLTMLALDRAGAEIVCLAPDKDQADVVDHTTNKPSGERRNVLREAARIARGKIRNVAEVGADELDAVVLPGGFGAAKNLCTFAKDGAEAQVDAGVARLLKEMHSKKKPIGALCIAPALVAKLFGADHKVQLTIGSDPGTASALEKMGARHRKAAADEVVVDAANRIATVPCYMLAERISQVASGAENLVRKVLEMAF
jgi:enhancing lycopene biosynthesis protein 2